MAVRTSVPHAFTKLARQSALAKGHTLTRFTIDGDGRLSARCKSCGKVVTAKVPGEGQRRISGGALRLCVASRPAPLPVFVTNQPEPVAPRIIQMPAPVAEPFGKRLARAVALGFAGLFLPPLRRAA